MINEILTEAGINHAQGRFLRMPDGTHAVYFDDIDADGPDPVPFTDGVVLPQILKHSATIELYEQLPDPEAESAIEARLKARGLPWTKQDRYWLQDIQRYQVVYEISYVTKT